MRTGSIQAMFLRTICAFLLSGILVAGLGPFHAPRNEVRWLGYGSGLFFGKYGSIVSASSFKAGPLAADSSCSLEIWLEPSRVFRHDSSLLRSGEGEHPVCIAPISGRSDDPTRESGPSAPREDHGLRR